MAVDNVTITEGTSTTGTIAADDVSGVKYQVVKLDTGTDGQTSAFTGTIDEVSVIADGTVVVGTVPGIGVLADGTIGEIGTVTGVGVVAAGTLGEVGTVTGMGVLALGTVKMTEGSAVVKSGTITTILAGTQELLGTVGNLAKGTITSVANVAGGTVQINPVSGGSSPITYGTQLTGAGQTWATVSSVSGAGTFHYVQGCSIVAKSGTVDCFLGFGSALSGTNVIAKGNFSEGGGGIARTFPSPLAGSGTNTELIVEIGGAGTVDFTVDFWRGT